MEFFAITRKKHKTGLQINSPRMQRFQSGLTDGLSSDFRSYDTDCKAEDSRCAQAQQMMLPRSAHNAHTQALTNLFANK